MSGDCRLRETLSILEPECLRANSWDKIDTQQGVFICDHSWTSICEKYFLNLGQKFVYSEPVL